MIGGVITSTVLTLIVIPTVYEILDGWRARFFRAGRRMLHLERPLTAGGAVAGPRDRDRS